MINKNNILAIIPARSGSKRLPGKNTKLLSGKPLIQWTIEAALNSNFLDTVLVSTDDVEIIAIASALKAEVPFVRPDILSQDESTSMDVIIHALEFYKNLGNKFDYIMLLQPTSPLRTTDHIDQAIEFFNGKKADAVVSVCPVEHSPLWSNTLSENCNMDSFLDIKIKNKRSQELPQYFRLNGAIYLASVAHLLEEGSFFLKKNAYAFKMTARKSIDVDTQFDFDLAQFLLTRKYG